MTLLLYSLILFRICLSASAQSEEFEFDLSHLDEDLYNPKYQNTSALNVSEPSFESSNPEEQGNFAEGDIYQPLMAKNAVKFKSKKWKKAVIPYEISDGFSELKKKQSAFYNCKLRF